MKRVLFVIPFLLVLSGITPSPSWGLGYYGYIGLYTDTAAPPDPTHTCINGTPMYPAEMWIWCLPSQNGAFAVEFALSYPGNIIPSTITENADFISIYLVDPPYGYSVGYTECLMDWHWVFHISLFVTDANPSYIEIVKHHAPVVPCVQAANCLPGHPTECIKVHTKLAVNMDCPQEGTIGVEEKSWGAIKNLYR